VIPEVKTTPATGMLILELAGIVKSAFPPSQITGVPCLSARRSVTAELVMLLAKAEMMHVVVLVTVVPAPVATCAVVFVKNVVCVQEPGIVRTTPMMAVPAFTPKAVLLMLPEIGFVACP